MGEPAPGLVVMLFELDLKLELEKRYFKGMWRHAVTKLSHCYNYGKPQVDQDSIMSQNKDQKVEGRIKTKLLTYKITAISGIQFPRRFLGFI